MLTSSKHQCKACHSDINHRGRDPPKFHVAWLCMLISNLPMHNVINLLHERVVDHTSCVAEFFLRGVPIYHTWKRRSWLRWVGKSPRERQMTWLKLWTCIFLTRSRWVIFSIGQVLYEFSTQYPRLCLPTCLLDEKRALLSISGEAVIVIIWYIVMNRTRTVLRRRGEKSLGFYRRRDTWLGKGLMIVAPSYDAESIALFTIQSLLYSLKVSWTSFTRNQKVWH